MESGWGGWASAQLYRVAIIGTGASAVQINPHVGKYARHFYVFQRTPAVVGVRNNLPTDPEWARSLKPGCQKERQRNYHIGALQNFARDEEDQVCDLFTVIARNVQARREAAGWPDLSPEELGAMHEKEDYRVMEGIRARIDAILLQFRYRSLALGKVARSNQHRNPLLSQLPSCLQPNPLIATRNQRNLTRIITHPLHLVEIF